MQETRLQLGLNLALNALLLSLRACLHGGASYKLLQTRACCLGHATSCITWSLMHFAWQIGNFQPGSNICHFTSGNKQSHQAEGVPLWCQGSVRSLFPG